MLFKPVFIFWRHGCRTKTLERFGFRSFAKQNPKAKNGMDAAGLRPKGGGRMPLFPLLSVVDG
jgi:hypothetical protein